MALKKKCLSVKKIKLLLKIQINKCFIEKTMNTVLKDMCKYLLYINFNYERYVILLFCFTLWQTSGETICCYP